MPEKKIDDGAGLAAAGNDTGASTTETASEAKQYRFYLSGRRGVGSYVIISEETKRFFDYLREATSKKPEAERKAQS